MDWVRTAWALREAPLHPFFKTAYSPIIERFSSPARAGCRGRQPQRRDSRITVGTSIARPPSAAVISTFAGRHDGRPYDGRGSRCGDIGAPHPPLARSPFPRGGRLGAVNAIAYICIPNTTTTATPSQTQTIPSPDPDPDSETPSHSKTNPSSQPERKRRGVVENF